MKNYFIASAFLLSSILAIHAQSNYSHGYIITSNNDTVTGWIDYRTDKMNAMACKFKQNLTDEEKVYLPGEITGYRFTDAGKFYISKSVTTDDGTPHTVFLEYMLEGIMNLYYYCEASDSNYSEYYFFENENGELISVTKMPDKVLTEENGKLRKLEDLKYQRLLSYIFRNCEPVKKKASKVQFTQKNMIDLTKDYHNLVCKSGEECIEFETTPDKHYIKTKFSVYGGWEIEANVPVSLFSDNPFSDTYALIKNSPIIGAQFNFSVPRWKKSLSLQTDISLTKRYLKLSQSGDEYNDLRLASNIGAKYTYHQGKFRPCIEAGIIFELGTCRSFMPGHYAGLGFDYLLKNDHFILFGINNEWRNNFFWVKDNARDAWRMKLGYTF